MIMSSEGAMSLSLSFSSLSPFLPLYTPHTHTHTLAFLSLHVFSTEDTQDKSGLKLGGGGGGSEQPGRRALEDSCSLVQLSLASL